MSDFDKEAEREKLREKYEREQAERQATQQMSELLLQGATMTNSHCDDHGDPIFRYDGEEFCPTCRAEGRETQRGEDEESEPEERRDTQREADADDAGAGVPGREEPADGEDPRATTGATERRSDAGSATANEGVDARRDDGRSPAPSAADHPQTEHRDDRPVSERRTTDRPDTGPGREPAASSGRPRPERGTDDVATAEASLRRTLVRFARRAEETDDPRQAREALRVAREAAEALAALHD